MFYTLLLIPPSNVQTLPPTPAEDSCLITLRKLGCVDTESYYTTRANLRKLDATKNWISMKRRLYYTEDRETCDGRMKGVKDSRYNNYAIFVLAVHTHKTPENELEECSALCHLCQVNSLRHYVNSFDYYYLIHIRVLYCSHSHVCGDHNCPLFRCWF
jgi:hypothetical protein